MTTNEETEALIMELRTTASDARAYARHALSRGRGIESANYDAEAGLYERAADGLAALTTPQDGGDALEARQLSEDDREALLQLAFDHDPDDCHPDDQKRCKCGALIGESDGVVVTADGWGHLVDMILAAGFSRAAVPDAAPTLCVECNEVEVLGKPEHLVLCMDCAYETGRAAVPDAATELRAERDAALAAIERVRAIHQKRGASWPHKGGVYVCGADNGIWPCPTIQALDGAPEPEWDSITIPRPVVPFGPRGVPENDATADYLLEVIRKIDQGYAVIGGSNVTATVRKLLAEVGLALRALPRGGNDE